MNESKRILLSPGFHAEPGATPGDLHDVYADAPWLGEGKRAYIGTLSKDAVEAWSRAETGRIAALGVIAGLRDGR